MTFSARAWLKTAGHVCCAALALPAAATCWIEHAIGASEGVFTFWAQVFALAPGLPGMWLRRAFYCLSLESCSRECYVGFGALFTHRTAIVDRGAYVGPYALVGRVTLRDGCLIGSRASLLSGGALHAMDAQGRWQAYDPSRAVRIEIGEHAWIGEGAIVIANVGAGAMVAAGSVIASPVPPHVQMAGNPARFVRRLPPDGAGEEAQGGADDTRVLAIR